MSDSRFPLPVLGDEKSSASVEPEVVSAPQSEATTVPDHGYHKSYWRSLEQKLNPEKYKSLNAREFPPNYFDVPKGVDRREFIGLLGASMALAGLTACSEKPVEPILAYTKNPEHMVVGDPLHYATAWSLRGVGTGLLVTAREGRPVKVEGNPEHPVNKGSTGAYDQALTISLYDPKRGQHVRRTASATKPGDIVTASWRTLREQLVTQGAEWAKDGGEGLRFLMEPSSSPSGGDLREKVLKRFPKAKFYAHAQLNHDNAIQGAELAFGTALHPSYALEDADVVVALDADLLEPLPENLGATRGWGERRSELSKLNRVYAIESRLSITGASADQRLRLKPSEIEGFARALLAELGGSVAGLNGLSAQPGRTLSDTEQKWVKAIARDLAGKPSRSLVAVGETQPPVVHAIAYAINSALGNVGTTLQLHPVLTHEKYSSVGTWYPELKEDVDAGKVKALVITAWNPVYASPFDLDVAGLIKKVPLSIYLGSHDDETAKVATWYLPAQHTLETWGDTRAVDGTASIIQPLIRPLFDGQSEHDLLSAFLDAPEQTAYDRLRAFWSGKVGLGFDAKWETWLSTGLIDGQTVPAQRPALNARGLSQALATAPAQGSGVELAFVPDYRVFDGRFANVTWLQEMPDPITKLTWDNAAMMSPGMAKKLGVDRESVIAISVNGQTLEAPVLPVPGYADDFIALPVGYGRELFPSGLPLGGVLGNPVNGGTGFNAYALQTSAALGFVSGAQVKAAGKTYDLALTQDHWTMEGREVSFSQTLAEFKKEPAVEESRGPLPTLLAPVVYEGYQWAMGVDTNRCTGCSACVVACVAENNIPVVGKHQIHRFNREMHWMRIDRYFAGDENEPEVINQPMMCQHCEAAPCEYVCPVNATTTSDEGLNEMVYNRCIGTRYCSNNCPYKVRRFNYLHWNGEKPALEQMAMNPDVTVRARGVMEKCTYCVQRIERTRIKARTEGRPIKEGEIVTACQQACPTHAISFGTLSDQNSETLAWHKDERRYDVLHELNTRPRTAYLMRVTNPNPELA